MNNDIVKKYFDEHANTWDSNENTPLSRLNYLVDYCKVQHGENVLDIGCGTGIISGILFERSGKVTAVDVSENMLALARQKHCDKAIDFVCADFYAFDGNNYDCAVIFNAYPHFLDKAALADKLASALKRGGRAIILHSISRDALNAHHSGVMTVSSCLTSAQQEAEHFKNYFDVDSLVDNEQEYMIRLIRK